jgi:hypothetical protein
LRLSFSYDAKIGRWKSLYSSSLWRIATLALGVEQGNKYSPTPSEELYRASNSCRVWKVRRSYAAISCNRMLDIFDDWQTGSALNGIEVKWELGQECNLRLNCLHNVRSFVERSATHYIEYIHLILTGSLQIDFKQRLSDVFTELHLIVAPAASLPSLHH